MNIQAPFLRSPGQEQKFDQKSRNWQLIIAITAANALAFGIFHQFAKKKHNREIKKLEEQLISIRKDQSTFQDVYKKIADANETLQQTIQPEDDDNLSTISSQLSSRKEDLSQNSSNISRSNISKNMPDDESKLLRLNRQLQRERIKIRNIVDKINAHCQETGQTIKSLSKIEKL